MRQEAQQQERRKPILTVRKMPADTEADGGKTASPCAVRCDGIDVLPVPWRVTFDTNPDDCNLSCTMCEEHSEFSPLKKIRIETRRPHRRMKLDIINNTVKELAPLGLREIIPSTMGEPLLYEHFLSIIDTCREYGVKLNLTTNGTWPRFGPEKWARLICPVASDVKISWNGTSRETQEGIMKGSALERRVEDLKKFIAIRDELSAAGLNRASITLQCTFMEDNVDELPDLVAFAAEIGVDRAKGHHLWVHFNEMTGQDMRRSPDSVSRWNRVAEKCKQTALDFTAKTGRKLKLQNFTPLTHAGNGATSDSLVCPFLGREAWINYEGRFDPCCAPDAERKSLGSFGNIGENGGLLNIWNSDSYRNLMSSYTLMPLCSKCTMKRPKAEVNQT